jgi:hypothetical protein
MHRFGFVVGSAAAALALGFAGEAHAASASIPAVATYDAATNANAVDANANGNAIALTGSADYAGFTAAVAAAFANGTGGVANFDTVAANTTITAADTLDVTFAGKTLPIARSRDMRVASYGSATAISGSNQFDLPDLQENTQSFTLTFGPIAGGNPAGEGITAIGFTANSRNGFTPTVDMQVTYDDATTSATLSDALTGTAAADDTFFGFVAPAGRTISSLTVTRTARVPFDDLGFITNGTPVPEPAAAGLIVIAGGALVGRRRRRRA